MDNLDTIDIEFWTNAEDGHYAVLMLNGAEVSKPFDLHLFLAADGLRHVEYEILTCSCGHAGCAGIDYGTTVKRRRYTVEWRDVDCGLPKRFYSFSRIDYDAVTRKALKRVLEIVAERENLEGEYDFSGQIPYRSMKGYHGFERSLDWSRNYLEKHCSK